MLDLLSLGNLNALVLDLNAGPIGPRRGEEQQLHLCPAIALLPTLRTLHVRMHLICPDILKVLDSDDNLRLNTVVINMGLRFNVSGVIRALNSRRCPGGEENILHLKADMQEQAKVLASRMSSLNNVRILTSKPSTGETLSLNILTGKTTILSDDQPWEDAAPPRRIQSLENHEYVTPFYKWE
ncbi:hypothetical protein F5B22DRAFT_248570 [Xylaria bambusicola]|uniref:uncharacterized protein n=1 Tax=Xylaria bambusicola TaxID=326684 RepID=UPI0020087C4D|nr:uncharacterized protein F5B22DRAFT_248570 [Xylaria bambusicola]KAI0513324.1 hypothetical protein F5B22DRAFT_248570 [Xylaria bambusicola]